MALFHVNDSRAFENYRMCHKCGGKCCKTSPCILDASDIDDKSGYNIAVEIINKNFSLVSLLDSSAYRAMNYFDFPYLYVASASEFIGATDLLSLRGPCVNLTKKGCKFSSIERPAGGRLLIPDKENGCHYEKREQIFELIYSWIDFQNNLKEAYELITSSSLDEEVSRLYQNYDANYDSFMEDSILAGPVNSFLCTYDYCKMAQSFGINCSFKIMNLLQTYVQRYPNKALDIIEFYKSIPDYQNVSEETVRRELIKKGYR